jgi:sulfate-transporting ATPase
MATEPSILLLDEPAAGLDENSTEELITHIRRLAGQRGLGILLVEHDVSMVMRTCDRVVAMNFGEEIITGTPAEVRAHPVVISAYLGRSEQEHQPTAAEAVERVPEPAATPPKALLTPGVEGEL